MKANPDPIHLIVPGPLDQRTGGYLYDRHMVEALRAAGRHVVVHELDGRFPDPDAAAKAACRAALSRARAGTIVIDALALLGFAGLLDVAAGRRCLALVHHPLALETGLDGSTRRRFVAGETALWRRCAGVIVTSRATARDVALAGIAADRIAVVMPGTARSRAWRPRRRGRLRLLCVASLTPRKGHLTLLRALDRPARLDLAGSAERDRAHAGRVATMLRARGLLGRVRRHGEVDRGALDRLHARADLFVLPSRHEGYGMAFAEALAAGLPVVGCKAGAVPMTVPPGCGVLLPPQAPRVLRRAIRRAARSRRRMATRARAMAVRFPDWPRQGRAFAEAIARLSG
jgi:glycosyltransferase involved in cell wall biosynthesis